VIGKLPFDDTNHKRLLRLILQGPTFPVNRDSSQDFQDLVTTILKRESSRPSIAETRQSHWFTQNAFSVLWSGSADATWKHVLMLSTARLKGRLHVR